MTHDAPTSTVAVAWYGRVASGDPIDVALSLSWQLDACRRTLPDPFHIVATFYDVGSGLAPAEVRSQAGVEDCPGIPIPRDGGLAELLEQANRPDRPFDAVVCGSIDRISRSAQMAASVECELDRAGVTLLAVDDGISVDASGLIDARPVQQAIAEWYLISIPPQRLGTDHAHADPHVRDAPGNAADIDQSEGKR